MYTIHKLLLYSIISIIKIWLHIQLGAPGRKLRGGNDEAADLRQEYIYCMYSTRLQ